MDMEEVLDYDRDPSWPVATTLGRQSMWFARRHTRLVDCEDRDLHESLADFEWLESMSTVSQTIRETLRTCRLRPSKRLPDVTLRKW